MISVTEEFGIRESDLSFRAQRSGGPGGQHVNTSDTAIVLTYNLYQAHLPEAVRQRLLQRPDHRIHGGIVQIVSEKHRSQKRNREEALLRLVELVRSAARPPKKRRKTRPTRNSVERRIDTKSRRGQIKRLRGRVDRAD